MPKIKVTIDELDKAIKAIKKYKKHINDRIPIFLQRLAEIGCSSADVRFQQAQYDGESFTEVSIQKISDNKIAVVASGAEVLFIEFGTGVKYANPQHPEAEKFGFERGGYGQGKGANPNGWAYYGEAGTNGQFIRKTEDGKEVYRTFGNPANMPMYNASKDIMSEVQRIAKEVFTSD